jgi:hypothetical protein
MSSTDSKPGSGKGGIGVEGDPGPFPESPTATLMARLFGVPLVIVGVIVGCSVLVVLLFGGISEPPQRDIKSLLTTLEQNTGERSMGVLFTQEKELWQVAQELALRLNARKTELTAQDLNEVVERLSNLVRQDAERVSQVPPSDDVARHQSVRRERLHFVMHALARTGDSRVVPVLAERLGDRSPTTRREAIRALASLEDLPEVAELASDVAALLQDSDETVRMVAAAGLSSIGGGEDKGILKMLVRSLVDESVEVQWNAALTLARLGSDRGRMALMDLLDRSFLEKDGLMQVKKEDGTIHRSTLPPDRVAALLEAAMDAAANLDDEGLWSQIELLSEDDHPSVSGRAQELLKNRGAPAGV